MFARLQEKWDRMDPDSKFQSVLAIAAMIAVGAAVAFAIIGPHLGN